MRVFIALFFLSVLVMAGRVAYVLRANTAGKCVIYIIAAVLAAATALTFVWRRRHGAFATLFAPAGYIVMGVWAISITFMVINGAVNLIAMPFGHPGFRYWSTLICVLACLLGSVWSLVNARYILHVRETSLEVPNLPQPSIKVVLLSDIHINDTTKPERIRALFDRVTGLGGDIIVIAGDVLDTNLMADDRYLNYGFERLKAPAGVYAVSGNHDYYTGINVFNALCEATGIQNLDDERIITASNGLAIAGIKDHDWNNQSIITNLINSVPIGQPLLFVSHRPESFDYVTTVVGPCVVQLSGHTHAGQIPPVEIARRLLMRYGYGWYRKGVDALYVTAGARWWGPPMRFASLCEVAVITLNRSADKQEQGGASNEEETHIGK
jgi:predicted MPP superfamily phosphohydrolase